MESFGKKLREAREAKSFSQAELAKRIGSYHSIIDKYDHDEVKPTVDVVKKLVEVLETTAGYLFRSNSKQRHLKYPLMLKRLNDINSFSSTNKEHILYTLDTMMNNVKFRKVAL